VSELILRGKYALDELIGRGGMGEVFGAHNLATGRRIAIKRLPVEKEGTPDEWRARFVQEARAISRLEHTNVVQVLDVDFDQDFLYLVMERLEGESLRDRLERTGPLSPAASIEILLPILDALEYAHGEKIVHRDLKPENIYLATVRGAGFVPKIIDFGVAKVGGDLALALTKTGEVLGTPHYIAPEQIESSRRATPAADVYAMGVILYECLSGELPFDAPSYTALIQAIMTKDPEPLSRRRPDLDPIWDAIVERATERRPEARFSSARAMADELLRAIAT
jgi:eukaryotic-like serine/threonine-protein kinase